MFVMAKEFAGALKAARMFACEDETRSHMNCVHVSAEGSALRLVSTDGHTLWACEIPARDSAADHAPCHQTPWNVALADVDALIKRLKDGGEIEVSVAKRSVAGVEFAQHTDCFPPYAQVIPHTATQVPGKVLPEFAAEYVTRCCEALTHYSKGFNPGIPKKLSKRDLQLARNTANEFLSPPIAWRGADELDPAIFYSPKFPAALAIVMPRKGAGNNNVAVEDFVTRIKSERRVQAA